MIRTADSNRGHWLAKTALGAALALGVIAGSATISTPAYAAKKPKPVKMAFSKGFIAVAGPAQTAIDALTGADAAANAQAKTMLEQAFSAIAVEDDRYLAGTLAVNLGGKLKDPAMQRRGVKEMLASGKVAPADSPRLTFIVGQLAFQAKDNAEAIQYLEAAQTAGHKDENLVALLAEAYIANNQAAKGIAVLKSALAAQEAAGTKAPEAWYRRGIASAYKANLVNETSDLSAMLIRNYPTAKNFGLAATILREMGKFQSQEVLDVVRLMARTKSFSETRDYVEYIEAADARRLPGEVLDVINAGLASGMLKANDMFVRDAQTQATARLAADKAGLDGYVRDANKAGASEATISGAADALLSYGRFAEAETLYNLALAKPGADRDRTLNRIGIAQIDQGKYAAAQETLAKVGGKRATIAKLWAAYAASKAAPPVAAAAAATAPK